jgi:hypothetical protein
MEAPLTGPSDDGIERDRAADGDGSCLADGTRVGRHGHDHEHEKRR